MQTSRFEIVWHIRFMIVLRGVRKASIMCKKALEKSGLQVNKAAAIPEGFSVNMFSIHVITEMWVLVKSSVVFYWEMGNILITQYSVCSSS